MKYLGEEKEVITKKVRKIEYIRCDNCKKKIKAERGRNKTNHYVKVETWHNDWGNDSRDSRVSYEFCPECASSFVADYVKNIDGSEGLSLSSEYLWDNENYSNYDEYGSDAVLVSADTGKRTRQ